MLRIDLQCQHGLLSVVIIARQLAEKGQIDAFAHQVRLVRGRFGSYEPIDFLALLIGYAMSGERTLEDFFERVTPFKTAFMALFGRKDLPHRTTLSRFLANVDRSCLEAFRTLFEQHSFSDGWTGVKRLAEFSIGKVVVTLSLTSMQRARQRGSEHFLRTHRSLLFDADLMLFVRQATPGVGAAKWCELGRQPCKSIHTNGLERMQAEEMGIIKKSLLQRFELLPPT